MVTDALDWSEPSLVVATDAVLFTTPQSAASVGELRWTERLALAAMSPKEQLSTPAAIWQSVLSSDQSKPVGSVSLTVTPRARPAPLLVTRTSKPIASPALTGPAGFADFSISIWAHRTSTSPASLSLPFLEAGSFVAPTVAVFWIVPQSAFDVGRETVIVFVAPEAIVPNEQLSALAAPMEQEPASAPPSVHVPAGSVSFRVTPVASAGPRLVTLMVNLAWSPASTSLPESPSSGVFSTLTSGQRTVIWPASASLPSFVDEMRPVLSMTPHESFVVPLVSVTLPVAPDAMLPTVQVSVWSLLVPPIWQVLPEPVEPEMLHSTPARSGRSSLTTTPRAVPSPLFTQDSWKLIESPASLFCPSGVFVMWTSAGRKRLRKRQVTVSLAPRWMADGRCRRRTRR